jgi:hypothetical protein
MGNSQKEGPLSAVVLDKFSELITTALGLVAALAWNEAIEQLFTQLFGEAGGALAAKVFYALIVTLVVIFATYLGQPGRRAGEETRSGARQWLAWPRPLEGIV